MKINKILVAGAAVAMMMTSCHRGWKVEGTIAGADADSALVLEQYINNLWVATDTLAMSNGKFAYAAPEALEHSDIMRVRAGQTVVYFPIDSIETVKITPAGNGGYRITGSTIADQITLADSLIAAAIASQGQQGVIASEAFKRQLYEQVILNDQNGLASYYVVNKQIGGQPLFDLTKKFDTNIYAAVATKFKTQRPTDPRTAYLEAQTMRARQATNQAKGASVEASLQQLPRDINLYDSYGKQHKLSEAINQGHVVILSFVNYNTEIAPAYNVELNKVYDGRHGQGLDIYQVSMDGDEAIWKQSARNLPWTAVYAPRGEAQEIMMMYNLNIDRPTTYIINRQGDIAERVDDPTTLAAVVAKYM